MLSPACRSLEGISRRPVEPGFPVQDGPYFLPAMVGADRMEYDPDRHLFHDFGTDAVDHVTSLIMTLHGSVTLSAPQHEQILKAGDVFIITTPQPVRLLLRRQSGPWEFFYVNFKGAQGRQALEWLRKRQRGIFNLPVESALTRRFVRGSLDLIRRLQDRRARPAAEWSVECYRWFMSLVEAGEEARSARGAQHADIGATPGLVATHFRTLKEYARQMNYSPGYLSRKLAKTWHKAPGATLKEAQLEHACRLLEQGDLPVGEVALSVGYQSVSSFIRAFRLRQDMTPKQYRRRHQLGLHPSGKKTAGKKPARSSSKPASRKKRARR